MLAAFNPRIEARYALDLYFKERGDRKFRGVEDLYATKSFAGENDWLRFALGQQAERLDTPDAITHTLRITNLQRILYKVMADNNLDALVYVYTTIPAPLVYPSRVAAVYDARVEPRVLKAGTKMSNPDLVPGEPSLKDRSRHLPQRRRQLGGELKPRERSSGDRGAGGFHPRGL